MVAGFQRVFILGDGDTAGAAFSKEVYTSLTNGVRIHLPNGSDVNDIYLAEGQEAILNLLKDM